MGEPGAEEDGVSEDLRLAIHARNARFRAWKAHGLPIEGGWKLGQRSPERWVDTETGETVDRPRPPYPYLRLQCTACGWSETGAVGGLLGAKTWAQALDDEEWDALKGVDRKPTPPSLDDWHCPHLEPLLTPEEDTPPEVVALTALEMLSTG